MRLDVSMMRAPILSSFWSRGDNFGDGEWKELWNGVAKFSHHPIGGGMQKEPRRIGKRR
jgi:hypothetical protein